MCKCVLEEIFFNSECLRAVVTKFIDLVNHDKAMIEHGILKHFCELDAAEEILKENLTMEYYDMLME